jgi:hypothetical protein
MACVAAFFILLFVIGLTAWLIDRARHPRVRHYPPPVAPPRRCSSCSYDLTGNASGVCPECGGSVRW